MDVELIEDEKEEEKKEKNSLASWLVPIGIGVAVVAAVGITVYIVKSKRCEELRTMRFGQEDDEDLKSLDYDLERKSRYWNWLYIGCGSVKKFFYGLGNTERQYRPIQASHEVDVWIDDHDPWTDDDIFGEGL